MTYDPIISVKLLQRGWPGHEEKLDFSSLHERQDKLSEFVERCDDALRYLAKATEDETLPDRIYYALDRAYDKLDKMRDMAAESVEAIDDILKAWRELEDDLAFVFCDAQEILEVIA